MCNLFSPSVLVGRYVDLPRLIARLLVLGTARPENCQVTGEFSGGLAAVLLSR